MTVYINGVAQVGAAPTKEFFAHAGNGDELYTFHSFPGYRIDAQDENAEIGFYVPQDFTSITEAVVVIYAVATATHRFHFYSSYGAEGEALNTHGAGVDDQDVVMTASFVHEVDISGILADLAAGDYVGIVVWGADVNVPNVMVMGVRLKYS